MLPIVFSKYNHSTSSWHPTASQGDRYFSVGDGLFHIETTISFYTDNVVSDDNGEEMLELLPVVADREYYASVWLAFETLPAELDGKEGEKFRFHAQVKSPACVKTYMSTSEIVYNPVPTNPELDDCGIWVVRGSADVEFSGGIW